MLLSRPITGRGARQHGCIAAAAGTTDALLHGKSESVNATRYAQQQQALTTQQQHSIAVKPDAYEVYFSVSMGLQL